MEELEAKVTGANKSKDEMLQDVCTVLSIATTCDSDISSSRL